MKNVKYCRSSLLVLVSLLILVELNRRQIEVTVLQKPDICQFIIVVICERMIYSCTFLSTRKGWLAFLRYFFSRNLASFSYSQISFNLEQGSFHKREARY